MKLCILVTEVVSGLVAACESVAIDGVSISVEVLKSADGLRVALNKIASKYDGFINWCVNMSAEGVTALQVTQTLEELQVPFAGCASNKVAATTEDRLKLAYYADLLVPRFNVINRRLAPKVEVPEPSVVYSNNAALDGARKWSTTADALQEVSSVVVVEEKAFPAIRVVIGTGVKDTAFIVVPPTRVEDGVVLDKDDAVRTALEGRINKIAKDYLGFRGIGELVVRAESAEKLWFQSISLSPQFFVEELALPIKDLVARQLESSLQSEKNYDTTFYVAFAGMEAGFIMRAARDLAEGEIAFHDEGRAFNIVTKGHVRKNWAADDQKTFSEYAWPLGTDGHTYATWDERPSMWRPINHSCNPNLFFAANHSLNVVASRPIAKDEELTMDYATFCDFTMKPFNCFCKASCCRDLVKPDAESLAKYSVNAWHRRQPNEEEQQQQQ